MAAGQQAMVVGQAPSGPMLLRGTPVLVRLRQEMSTEHKAIKVGQRFDMETAEPISLNGAVVIPAGSYAAGEITTVRNKGMWGKSGLLEGRFLYVRANGREIRLSGNLDTKGSKAGWGAAAATVATAPILPVAGFFITGTSAKLASGSTYTAYLDEDMPVMFAGPVGPAPMMVGVPTQPAPVSSAAPVAVRPALIPVASKQPPAR
jgi:hypothetical protein